jgi:hypothetical protein
MNLTKTRQLSADLLKLLKQVYEQNGASNLEKDLLKENLRALYKAIDETEEEENKNSNGYHKVEETPQPIEPENTGSISSPEAVQELIQEIRAEAVRTIEQPITSSFTFLDEEPEEIEEETKKSEPAHEMEQKEYSAAEPVIAKIEALPEPEPDPKPEPIPMPKPVTIPDPEPITEPDPVPDPVTIPDPEPIPDPTPVPPPPISVQTSQEREPAYQQVAPEPIKVQYYMSSETEELFTTRVAKELSDKLNQSHLPDLHKAFGLNDRLLTISELFGGDPAAFKETMDTLNSYSHFDQAKRFLSENVVDKYRWTLPAKKDSARQLIQLIRRKYL